LKMFEYMAAGRAIISSDLPVIHEVLDDRSALFCPPEDAASWIAAVGKLIHDPALRLALTQDARMKIDKHSILARQEKILKFMAGGN